MMEPELDCLFCRIVAGEIPAEIVFSDEQVVAFADINPQAPTHVLVIPRHHIPDAHALTDADGDLLADMFGAVRTIAADAGIAGGYRVVTNIGAEAGQSVFHLHFHVLGGRPMAWPPG